MRNAGRVQRSLAVTGSSDRIVLLSWAAEPEPLIRNLARVDRHGNVVWRAELPGKAASDCFVDLRADGELYVARTFSEWELRLDAAGEVQGVERAPAVT